MYWVYVLRCENKIIYVGETKNLVRRMYQHKEGGCGVTKENKILELIGLYKVVPNYFFVKYVDRMMNGLNDIDNRRDDMRELLFSMDKYNLNHDYSLYVENYITELCMDIKENVFGGKYLNNYRKEKYSREFEKEWHTRPLCGCGLPCEVRKFYNGKKIKLNYTCCLRNAWVTDIFKDTDIRVKSCCNFYQEYLEDIEIRVCIQD